MAPSAGAQMPRESVATLSSPEKLCALGGCTRPRVPHRRGSLPRFCSEEHRREFWERKRRPRVDGQQFLPLVAPEGWKKAAKGAIAELVRERKPQEKPLSASDVHERVGEPPHPNAWGPLWQWARRRGLVIDSGRRIQSRRPERRGSEEVEYLPGVIS